MPSNTGSSSPIVVTGLTNGTAYTATVHATNSVGDSVESSASAPFTPSAPAFSPPDLAGLIWWLKADALSLSDGASVTTWTDSASGAHDAPMVSAAPIFKTGILNGKPVVRWDGTSGQALRTGAFSASQPLTIFAVVKAAVVGYQFVLDGLAGNDLGIRQGFDGSNKWDISAGATVEGPAGDTSPHILAAVVNGASSNLRVGGGAGTAGNAGSSNPGGFEVGAYGGSNTVNWNGDMAEIIVYNTALSTTNLNLVGGYLATKYGLTWTPS